MLKLIMQLQAILKTTRAALQICKKLSIHFSVQNSLVLSKCFCQTQTFLTCTSQHLRRGSELSCTLWYGHFGMTVYRSQKLKISHCSNKESIFIIVKYK